jgi:hypothetical protein
LPTTAIDPIHVLDLAMTQQDIQNFPIAGILGVALVVGLGVNAAIVVGAGAFAASKGDDKDADGDGGVGTFHSRYFASKHQLMTSQYVTNLTPGRHPGVSATLVVRMGKLMTNRVTNLTPGSECTPTPCRAKKKPTN